MKPARSDKAHRLLNKTFSSEIMMSERDKKVQSSFDEAVTALRSEKAVTAAVVPFPLPARLPDDDAFARIWALGYHRLCPIMPPGAPVGERSSIFKRIAAGKDPRGKTPGVKWPNGNWSGFDFVDCESTEAHLPRWQAMGAGVGVKTGRGLALIDADATDPAAAAIIAAAIKEHFGHLPARIGRPPKAGYLVRVEGEFQYARIEFGERDERGRAKDRVEILYEDRQFVAHGVHPGTGKPYHWPEGMPALVDVPTVAAADLLAFLEALRELIPSARRVVQEGGSGPAVPPENLVGDIDKVRAAIASLPNTTALFPARENYVAVAYAVRGAFGPLHEEEGKAAFLDWCARWDDPDGEENDPAEAATDWARAKHPRIGAEWLFKRALQHGGNEYARAIAAPWLDPPGMEPIFPEPLSPDLRDGGNTARRLTFTSFDEAADGALTDSAAPLIKGLLDQGAMSVLYGESNTGKTFVALDIAYHVATGRDWGGMRATAAPVVYIAAEGGRGARKRVAALRQRHGGPGGEFLLLLSPIDLLHPNADLRDLLKELRTLPSPPGLIVVDTFSRAMAGGDENSSTDMGAMVKHLDAIRSATGAHVLVVHHSGKDASKGARGHSLLRAAIDTEMEVKDGRITVTKQRDLDGSWSSLFTLETVELGHDAAGDAVTSCVLRLLGEHTAAFSEAQLIALREKVGDLPWKQRDSGRGGKDVVWIGNAIATAFGMDLKDKRDKAHVRELQKHLEARDVLKIVARERRRLLVWGAMPSQPDNWCEPVAAAPPAGAAQSVLHIDEADTPPTAADLFE